MPNGIGHSSDKFSHSLYNISVSDTRDFLQKHRFFVSSSFATVSENRIVLKKIDTTL